MLTRKPLSPDEIVERALKRLPKVPLEVVDEEFEPRTITKRLWTYDHRIRVELHHWSIFWRYELQEHLLSNFRGEVTLNSCSTWKHWKWSRPFLSEKACVRAAHKRLDELDEEPDPERPKRLLSDERPL